MKSNSQIERRIRLAALLVLAGLVLEFVTLNILHPLSFVAFAVFGIVLIGAGILVFLLTLLHASGPEVAESPDPLHSKGRVT
jgi:hypothetical protein